MRKIPTVFKRNPDDRRYVLDEVTPGCEWVIAGEGSPLRKYDGTCVMFDGEGWWARREVKPGKNIPPNFLPEEYDKVTRKFFGWEPVAQSSFAKFHAEAVADAEDADYPEGCHPGPWPVGTYELIGPKINGNPEHAEAHELIWHDKAAVIGLPKLLTFEGLRDVMQEVLKPLGVEGVVWHHPDGRMAKLKVRDFPNGGSR